MLYALPVDSGNRKKYSNNHQDKNNAYRAVFAREPIEHNVRNRSLERKRS